MSNTIRIKRRAQGGGAGAPTTMANGELAMNEHNDVLWYGEGTGGAGGTATQAIPVGGSGAFVALSGNQTSIAGEKTFTNLLRAANGMKVGTSNLFSENAGTLVADSIVVNTGTVTFENGATIVVPAPSAGNHPATRDYVDNLVSSGVVWLAAAKVATVDNISLSGIPSTIDGVSVEAGDRILVKSQTSAAQNGVYVVASGAWSRATDFDAVSSAEISSGKSIFVQSGTATGGTSWVLSTTGTITLGTTPLTWTQIGGGQSETGKNVGDSGLNLFVSKVGTELEIRKLVGNTSTGISIDAPGDLNGSARISISTVPLANGGLGTNASTSSGFPLITGGTCTFAASIPADRGGTNNNLSTAADYEIAVTDTNNSQKRITTTNFGTATGILRRTNPTAGVYGYTVDTATYLTTTSTIDGGTF